MAAELRAQLARFHDLVGAPPTLVNAHHHVQVFPPVGAILERLLAGQRPLPYFRRVREPWRLLATVPGARGKRAFLSLLGRRPARRLACAGFPGADWHVGITNPPCVADPEFFTRWLRKTPGRVVELCCHPGYLDATLIGRDCTAGDGQQLRRVREQELLRQPGLSGGLPAGRVHLAAAADLHDPRRGGRRCRLSGPPSSSGSVALVLLGANTLLWPQRDTVYPIFAEAGRRWLAGGDLYEPVAGLDAYRYSPLVAALLVPFGLLPDGPGGLLWRLAGSAVFCGGLAWWGRAVLPPALTRGQRALLFLLPAPLTFGNVHNGQANVLIVGLLLLAVAAVARERFNVAALCLAVACLFKVYPIAVGLLLAALYPRRLAPRLGLLLAAGLLLPFLLQRSGYVAAQYAGWVEHLAQNDRQLRPRALWYRDARLLWGLSPRR